MAKRRAGGGLDVTITGVKEIDRALAQLPPKVAKKVIRQAIRQALKPVAQRAKLLAPRGETGQLKRAIKVRAMPRRRGRIGLEVRVGEGDFKGETFYAAFVEYGTSKMDKKPFMRPAFDQTKDEARNEAIRLIRAGIEREAAALGRSGRG